MLRILTKGLQCLNKAALANVVHDASRAAPYTLQQHHLTQQLFKSLSPAPLRTFTSFTKIPTCSTSTITTKHVVQDRNSLCFSNCNLLEPRLVLPLVAWGQPVRNNVKFSNRKCKYKTVKAVVKRFYRLEWGGWIRPRMGRHKRLWTKTWKRRQRDRRHVLCNAHYSKLFDHMTTKCWRKPKYYIDDPYEPYHKRYGVRKTTDMYKNKPLIC